MKLLLLVALLLMGVPRPARAQSTVLLASVEFGPSDSAWDFGPLWPPGLTQSVTGGRLVGSTASNDTGCGANPDQWTAVSLVVFVDPGDVVTRVEGDFTFAWSQHGHAFRTLYRMSASGWLQVDDLHQDVSSWFNTSGSTHRLGWDITSPAAGTTAYRIDLALCWLSGGWVALDNVYLYGSAGAPSATPTLTATPTFTFTPTSGVAWVPTAELPFCPDTPTPGPSATLIPTLAGGSVGITPIAGFPTLGPSPTGGTVTRTPTSVPTSTGTPAVTMTATAMPTPTTVCRSKVVLDYVPPVTEVGIEDTGVTSCYTLFPGVDTGWDARPIEILGVSLGTIPAFQFQVPELELCVNWLRLNLRFMGIDFGGVIALGIAMVGIGFLMSWRREL